LFVVLCSLFTTRCYARVVYAVVGVFVCVCACVCPSIRPSHVGSCRQRQRSLQNFKWFTCSRGAKCRWSRL